MDIPNVFSSKEVTKIPQYLPIGATNFIKYPRLDAPGARVIFLGVNLVDPRSKDQQEKFPKPPEPRQSLTVHSNGIWEDKHRGFLSIDQSTGSPKITIQERWFRVLTTLNKWGVVTNSRPVTVVEQQDTRVITQKMGISPIKPGELKENIKIVLPKDLNFSELPTGTLLWFVNTDKISGPVLRVTGGNKGCMIINNLLKNNRTQETPQDTFANASKDRRGVTCIVKSPGEIHAGAVVHIYVPEIKPNMMKRLQELYKAFQAMQDEKKKPI